MFELTFDGYSKPSSSADKDAPPPWSDVVKLIEADFVRLGITTDELEMAMQVVEFHYAVAGQIVRKKRWDQGLRIQASRNMISVIEPLGDLLLAYCNLAIELHAIGFGNRYRNALHWITVVANEMKASSLKAAFTTQTKGQCLSGIRSWGDLLKDFKNPVDPDLEPATYELMQATIEVVLSGKAPTVFKPLWNGMKRHGSITIRGLLPSWRRFATALEEDGVIARVESGKLIVPQVGRMAPKTLVDLKNLTPQKIPTAGTLA